MSAEAAFEWRETQLSGGTIRYLSGGAGPPVLFLHGLSGSVDWWRRNLRAFAESFHVHAIDLVRSSPRRRSPFILSDTADLLAEWMRAAGLSRASIIGHSMGGNIAARLTEANPELVASLVLVNAAVLFPATRLKVGPAPLLRWLPTFPPLLVPILVGDALRAGPRRLWEASRDLLTSDLRPTLKTIRAPTLILWGERDGLLPLALANELHAAIAGSELRILPGAGHNPMWEAPVLFNELVLEFLHRRPLSF